MMDGITLILGILASAWLVLGFGLAVSALRSEVHDKLGQWFLIVTGLIVAVVSLLRMVRMEE